MEALDFFKEKQRMCQSMKCVDCKLNEINLYGNCYIEADNFKEMARRLLIVEQWAKEHPHKTYKQDFLEKFPNAFNHSPVAFNNNPMACRDTMYKGERSCYRRQQLRGLLE